MLTRPLTFLAMCLPLCLAAQIGFQRQFKSSSATYGAPYNVLAVSDGDFLVTSSGTEPGPYPSATLTKFDSIGNLLWMKADTVDLTSEFVRVLPRSGGCLFVSDRTDGGIFDDRYVLRGVDTAGVEIWRASYSRNGLRPMGAALAADSGYFLAGELYNLDLHLAKTDADGQLLWSRTYRSTGDALGFTCVTGTPDGGAVVGGYFADNNSSALVDLFLMRVDASGGLVWARYYPHTSTIRPDRVSSVTPTSDGGYVMTCHAPMNNFDVMHGVLVKLHADGSINWQYDFTGALESTEFNSVIERADGSYMVCGYATDPDNEQDLSLSHIDSTGILIWSRNIGMSLVEAGYHIATCDDGFVMSGAVATSPLLNNAYYLVRTDSSGSVGCLDTLFALTAAPFNLTSTTLTLLDSSATLLAGGQVHVYKNINPLVETPCDIGTALQEAHVEHAFRFWPNPSSGVLQLEGLPAAIVSVELRALDGRVVKHFDQVIRSVSVEELAGGPYLILVRSAAGVLSRKVIVEH